MQIRAIDGVIASSVLNTVKDSCTVLASRATSREPLSAKPRRSRGR